MHDYLPRLNETEWLLGNYHGPRIFERTVRFRSMQKIKSIMDYEIIILVVRDFISIKHPAAIAITYSNPVFNNGYYNKVKGPKNGFCLVKEDGPDVIRTRDPRHVKAVS
jgi:hypothetical protein